MSECVVRMEMPLVCITENGYYGYCPMDRVWCIQRNAPPDITMREAYEAMTDKIPSWCPIICQLPEGHGRLIDANTIIGVMQDELDNDIPVTVDDYLGLDPSVPTIVPAEGAKRNDNTHAA